MDSGKREPDARTLESQIFPELRVADRKHRGWWCESWICLGENTGFPGFGVARAFRFVRGTTEWGSVPVLPARGLGRVPRGCSTALRCATNPKCPRRKGA